MRFIPILLTTIALTGAAADASAQATTTAIEAGVARTLSTDPAEDERVRRPAVSFVRKGDPVWEGILIGAAAGAVGGMIIAPYMLCGRAFDDSECIVIVRAALGIPLLAGSIVAGGLIDKYHVRGPVIWSSPARRAQARAGVFPRGGAGVELSIGFK